MAETWNACGVVVKGDCTGCYVWKWDDNTYFVVGAGVNNYNVAKNAPSYQIGLWKDFGYIWELQEFLKKYKKCELTTNTIEKIVEVSSQQSGPNGDAFIRGALVGGIGMGIATAMKSTSSSSTLAVYLKSGKKMLIEFYGIPNARMFQNDLFIF